MSWQDKLLQEEAESNSSDFRGSEESILGTTGAEFCSHSELTQAGNTGLSVGMNLTNYKKPVLFLLLVVVFRGHKGKRNVGLGFVRVF